MSPFLHSGVRGQGKVKFIPARFTAFENSNSHDIDIDSKG